jgi:hypothetical protein
MNEQPPIRWSLGLRRLIRGEEGQIIPLAGLLLLVMAALVFTVYNTGASVNRRLQTQNAADISAHTAALWHARGLNLVAGNNRAATRIAAVIIALRAVDRTLDTAALDVQSQKTKAAAKIAAGTAAKDPMMILEGQQDMQQALKEEKVITAMRSTMSKPAINSYVADQSGSLWSAMRSLEYFSSAITEYAVYAGQVRAMQTARFNTEGDGIGMVLSPTWAAFPSDYIPAGSLGPDATGRLPMVKGTFADFQNPVITGQPPYPGPGRTGARGGGGQGGGRQPIGNLPAVRNSTRAFFRIALPKSTKDGQIFRDYTQEESDKVFVDPGPQAWMPAPYLLSPSIRMPQDAVAGGGDLRELGVWAAAAQRSLAPFWTHRFISPLPADVSTAFARAKIVNPVSWDEWTQNWQAKLTHADFTYDRSIDPYGVGPEQLAANLIVMLDSGEFERMYNNAIGTPGKVLPGGPIDPREVTAARQWLERLKQGELQWNPTAGRALITH